MPQTQEPEDHSPRLEFQGSVLKPASHPVLSLGAVTLSPLLLDHPCEVLPVCELGGAPPKSLQILSPESSPKPESHQENLSRHRPKPLGSSVKKRGVDIRDRSRRHRPRSGTPKALCPLNSAPNELGGGGTTKAGRGAGSRLGPGWRVRGSPHGCAEGGRRAHGECSRGAPDWKCRGAGLAPGSAQSLSGSRPIESSFLGRTWTGPGRVLRRLLPPALRRAGMPRDGERGAASEPRRRTPSAGSTYAVTLTTVLSLLHFLPKFHSPHPQCPAP